MTGKRLVAGVLTALVAAGCAALEPPPISKTEHKMGLPCRRIESFAAYDGVEFFRTGEAYGIRIAAPPAVSGAWRFAYDAGTAAGYRFGIRCDDPAAALANRAVVLVAWLDAAGEPVESAYLDPAPDGSFSRLLKRPPEAVGARLEASLRWTREKTVRWSEPVCEAADYPARPVRIIVTKAVPDYEGGATVADNWRRVEALFQQIEDDGEKPDLVVFPETFATRGVRDLPYETSSEPIPGPYTEMLGRWAKRLNTNVATSIRRTDGEFFYNTGVVIDRSGAVVGAFDKVHLTVGEARRLQAGNSYPVFELDFGKVGILICWDLWFAESARELRLAGAELIAYPIASTGSPKNWDVIWPARCLDNQLYLAAAISGSNPCPARIIDPAGEVRAETVRPQTYAAATVDLSERFFRPYLSVGRGRGELGHIYLREARPETYRTPGAKAHETGRRASGGAE